MGGLLTMGTTLLAPALYIWKTGFLASRGCGWPGLPYLPGEGASWMQSLLPPPKRNSYNSPFVFCRNLELTSCYDAQGKEPRRMRSFSTLPRCQQGKFIWLWKVPARPLQPGPELCWLLGDRQPGPFPLLFLRPPSQPWQQPRRSHRHSQTAGRSQPDDGDTCPLQAVPLPALRNRREPTLRKQGTALRAALAKT